MTDLTPGDRVVDVWGNRGTVTSVSTGVVEMELPSGERLLNRRFQLRLCRCDGSMLLGNIPCECAELGDAV